MIGKLQKFLAEPAFYGSTVGVKRKLIGRAFFYWCCNRRMYKIVETARNKITLHNFFNPHYLICNHCGSWQGGGSLARTTL